jgi:hypothetical protein
LNRIKGQNLGELRAKSRQIQDHPQLQNDLIEYLQQELTGTATGTTGTTCTTSISEQQQEQQQQGDDDEEALQLDRELAKAHKTLQRLESKQEFVGRRLGSYQKSLALKEKAAAASLADDETPSSSSREKLESYRAQCDISLCCVSLDPWVFYLWIAVQISWSSSSWITVVGKRQEVTFSAGSKDIRRRTRSRRSTQSKVWLPVSFRAKNS